MGGRRRRGGARLARPRPSSRAGIVHAVVTAWRRENPGYRAGTCFCIRVLMEVPLQLSAAGWSPKLLLLFLLLAVALRGLEADERPRTREEECHFYAGGQVYPGEASRVSVADHSLHLSKAKSRWCCAKGLGEMWGKPGDTCTPSTSRGPGLGRLPLSYLQALSRPASLSWEVGGWRVTAMGKEGVVPVIRFWKR